MTTETPKRTDLERHLAELRAVRDELLPDAEDATVMSSLTVIQSEINKCEAELNA